MAYSENTCFIWPDFVVESIGPERDGRRTVYDSPRAGGDYMIPRRYESKLKVDRLRAQLGYTDPIALDGRARARLTTMLITMRRNGQHCPEITNFMLEKAENGDDLSVGSRAERFLQQLAKATTTIGQAVDIDEELRRNAEFLAHTESVEDAELVFLNHYLHKREWVAGQIGRPVVTVEGYDHIAALTSANTDSAQAFVAMWFDPSMDEVDEKAIKPAIEEAGYDAFIINRHDFTGKIDDEIIAQIRQSRFMVADFTHAADGTVRGSVYYEAGFAHGLNIPVIFTAQEGAELHFDTAHYNHIMWTPDDLPTLRKRLYDRILAVAELGPGPRATLG